MLHISNKDHVTNVEVLRRVSVRDNELLLEQVKQVKLVYYGHVARMSGDRLPRMALEGIMERVKGKDIPRAQ